ncbi:unnamed protein product [Brachionus calyciflorus]|uniref:Hexosyltransferase n=1 Tax=Brachionus calyciflorus TaxID=104777 RepID=A0A813PUH6_9BILA|nr:unnamed protein product [Brachionus calyciflorus]
MFNLVRNITKLSSKLILRRKKTQVLAFICSFIFGYVITDLFVNDTISYKIPNLFISQQSSQKIMYKHRPYNAIIELELKHKLFTGVLINSNASKISSHKFQLTNVDFLNHIFFFNRNSQIKKTNHILIKSEESIFELGVIDYLIQNYVNKYEWFLLVSESTYFRPDEIIENLKISKWSENIFLGSRDPNTGMCGLSSGYIISTNLLRALNSTIDTCIQQIGQIETIPNKLAGCLKFFMNIECTDKIKDVKLNFYNEKIFNFETAIQKLEFENSLTVSEVKDDETVNKLEIFFNKINIKKLEKDLIKIESQIEKNDIFTDDVNNKLPHWPLSIHEPLLSEPNPIEWDFLDETHFHNETINELNEFKKNYKNVKFLYGYRAFIPNTCQVYILFVKLNEISTKKEEIKKIYMFKPLGLPKILHYRFDSISDKITKKINVLVAFNEDNFESDSMNRIQNFIKFKKYFETISILFIKKSNNSVFNLENFIDKIGLKVYLKEIIIKDLSLYYSQDYLQLTTINIFSSNFKQNSLILYLASCSKFSSIFLENVLVNTVQNEQVYFPISFSKYLFSLKYDPNYKNEYSIRLENGYFNHFSKEFVSFYYSDYLRANNYSKEGSLFSKFLNSSIQVLSAPDKDLLCGWRNFKHCDLVAKNESKKCLEQKTHSIGTIYNLYNVLFNY